MYTKVDYRTKNFKGIIGRFFAKNRKFPKYFSLHLLTPAIIRIKLYDVRLGVSEDVEAPPQPREAALQNAPPTKCPNVSYSLAGRVMCSNLLYCFPEQLQRFP